MNLETSFNHGGHGEHGDRQHADFYALTKGVDTKQYEIYGFYSVFSVPSVVTELRFFR
jgi:hypothetical protein